MYHEGGIQCFEQHPTKSLVLTGGVEGQVFGANFTSGQSTGCIGKHQDSVEAVALSEELQIGASAGIDKEILIYDLAKLTIRHKISPTEYGGYTSIRFSSFPIKCKNNPQERVTMLLCASTLGPFLVLDCRDGQV